MSTEVNKNTPIRLGSKIRDDLTGRRFNRILVLGMYNPTRPLSRNNDQWWCLCDCASGDEKMKFPAYRCRLTSGMTQSCGCLSRQRLAEHRTTHGLCSVASPHHLYSTWEGVVNRCTAPNSSGYPEYGGRGITICDRWRNSFAAFVEDMEPSWRPGTTLDRITPNHNYSKEECRWATPKEQANNRRTNVLITMDGVTKTKMQWCEFYGIKFVTVCGRQRMGWATEACFKTPAAKRAVAKKLGDLTFNGKTQSVGKWAEETGIKANTIYQRILNLGWSVEEALTNKARDISAPHTKGVI